jgi:pimeloyl-ACP methyl ester carboxylesterase
VILESVVDANGLKKFPLLGISQGCAVSIDYTVRHPERVSHLSYMAGMRAAGVGADSRARSTRRMRC